LYNTPNRATKRRESTLKIPFYTINSSCLKMTVIGLINSDNFVFFFK